MRSNDLRVYVLMRIAFIITNLISISLEEFAYKEACTTSLLSRKCVAIPLYKFFYKQTFLAIFKLENKTNNIS